MFGTINNRFQQSVSFEGLNSNKRVAEKVLKEFKNEYGSMKSSTMINNFALLHKTDPKCLNACKSLSIKAQSLSDVIYDKKFDTLLETQYDNLDSFVVTLSKYLKNKKKANCWEESVIINSMLTKKGEKAKNIQLRFVNEQNQCSNHFSTVIGLKKGAKIEDPKTWGSSAVIVDAWSGVVMQAKDAINFFQEFIAGFGPKTTQIICDEADTARMISLK